MNYDDQTEYFLDTSHPNAQWRADTRFSVDSDTLHFHFMTLKTRRGLETLCLARHDDHESQPYKADVVRHPALRATYESIEDAHKAAALDFDLHVKRARYFYMKS